MTTETKSRGGTIPHKADDLIKSIKSKLTSAFKEINELKQRVGDLAKDVRTLKDMFSTNDNWGALAKKLIETGKEVKITDIGGHCWVGRVQWVDRYNIGFRVTTHDSEEEGMLLKGGLLSIFPTKE